MKRKPNKTQGTYRVNSSMYGSASAPTQHDTNRVIKFGFIFGLIGILLLGLFVFLSGDGGTDFESRTQDWANFSNEDVRVSLRYPAEWNLNVGTQELVRFSVNDGDSGVRDIARIEFQPNPDWLEINEWVTQFIADSTEEVVLSGREAYRTTDELRAEYFINSGPRIFTVATFEDSQEVADLLQTISIGVIEQPSVPSEDAGALINFESIAFKVLFDATNLADTRNIDNRPAIYGDSEADAKIQSLAETRGYSLRSEYTGEVGFVNGFAVANQIVDDWNALERAASNAGHDLDVTSGFRVISEQRDIFKGRLTVACANQQGSDCTLDQIKNGEVDTIIDTVLQQSSIPGYSRHHTGYTIDIQHTGQGGLDAFANTDGYAWLAADNFANAKRFGFIPSYPDGVERQGPDPEPWEYVWVGRDFLRSFE